MRRPVIQRLDDPCCGHIVNANPNPTASRRVNVFLSIEDVRRITGKKRHKAQIRVLAAKGYRYIVAATGEPLVRLDSLDAAQKPAHRQKGHQWDRIGSVRNLRT